MAANCVSLSAHLNSRSPEWFEKVNFVTLNTFMTTIIFLCQDASITKTELTRISEP